MSEMIERVARAIDPFWFQDVGDLWPVEAGRIEARREQVRQKARAAIEAMREPTDAMCLAGWQSGAGVFGKDAERPEIYRRSANSYEAMITAALKEPAKA